MLNKRKLALSAREAAESRGHTLPYFRWTGGGWNGGEIGANECPKCGAWVRLETNPAPNGCDITGSAVAVHCPGA